ncbi:sigma-70 family RNA polymerase sigma factor [Nannocystis pusilla]|uniref:sigma-70 family RNA polymerase sigma factor n=1 Tax=Nannocystis pusilla TaxID=889268 RepID=UPI003DA4CBB6
MADDRPGTRPESPQDRLAALRGKAALLDQKLGGDEPASPPGVGRAAPSSMATAQLATGAHKAWLAIGLVLMTGLGSIPVLLGAWFLATLFGVVLIAESLERTRGLAPTTYGGAFWLAVAFVAVLVALEIATWIPRGDSAQARGGCLTALLTRPAVAAVVLLLPTILLVRWDLGGTDVPDIVTTTALLCLLGYGLFVLPLALTASAIRLGRWLWRLGSSSSFRSGLVAGIATVLAALLPARLACAPPDADEDDGAFPEVLVRGADVLGDQVHRRGLVDGSLDALTRAAEVIPGTSGPWSLPPALVPEYQRDEFRHCVRELAKSSSQRAANWLVANRRADYESANAVAYTTILRVCKVHLRDPKGDLEGYYIRSVKQNYTRDYQRDPLRTCSSYEDRHGSLDRTDVVIDMQRKLCQLGAQDREIVLGALRGESSAAIGRALNMTAENVRQRLSRALKRIADD